MRQSLSEAVVSAKQEAKKSSVEHTTINAGATVSDNIYLRNFKDGRNTGIYTDLPKETIYATLRSVLL